MASASSPKAVVASPKAASPEPASPKAAVASPKPTSPVASSSKAKTSAPLVEVDPHPESDNDSQYESGAESATTSVTSSIYNYQYENGRRYHAYRAGKYTLPNDETEQDRLDLMHHIYLLMLGGKLYQSPMPNLPQRILDIGTGTGIWAVDIADTFESAQVIGTDLSPIQPRWVPPNVQFLVDDAESEWMFDGGFDLIHVRALVGAIIDWGNFLSQCYRNIKPGGHVELFEMPRFKMFCDDGTYTGTNLETYYSSVEKASKIAGRALSLPDDNILQSWLEEAGFEVSQPVTRATLPLGTWPADKTQKELGKWAAVTLESGFEAYGMALLTRVLGMTKEEVAELIIGCKKEVKSRSVHCYCIFRNYVAKKPDVETKK